MCTEGKQYMQSRDAGDLQATRRRLCMMQLSADSRDPTIEELTTDNVDRHMQTCTVVEFVLECASITVVVELQEGVFVALFGCPLRSTMKAVAKNGFTGLQDDETNSRSAHTSVSDPLPNVAKAPMVYRHNRPPHGEPCICGRRHHFKNLCIHGTPCPRCHHEDHRRDGFTMKAHRKKHTVMSAQQCCSQAV